MVMMIKCNNDLHPGLPKGEAHRVTLSIHVDVSIQFSREILVLRIQVSHKFSKEISRRKNLILLWDQITRKSK